MTISVNNQAFVFLCSVICGMVIALIYDFFRISRKAVRTGNLMTYAEDLLFWLIVAAIMFLTVYYSNNGELRSFIFLGAFIGALLYALLLSRAVVKSSMFFINILRTAVNTVLHIVYIPVRFCWSITSIPVRFTARQTKKAFRGIRRASRNRLSMTVFWRKAFKNIRKKI